MTILSWDVNYPVHSRSMLCNVWILWQQYDGHSCSYDTSMTTNLHTSSAVWITVFLCVLSSLALSCLPSFLHRNECGFRRSAFLMNYSYKSLCTIVIVIHIKAKTSVNTSLKYTSQIQWLLFSGVGYLTKDLSKSSSGSKARHIIYANI